MTEDTVLACPDYNTSDLRKDTKASGELYCLECRQYIEPTERPPKNHTNCQSGIPRKLADMDPDEVEI